MATKGLRFRGRLDGVRAEPTAVDLFRSASGEQSMKLGSLQPIVRPTPEFATGPDSASNQRPWLSTLSLQRTILFIVLNIDAGPRQIRVIGLNRHGPIGGVWPEILLKHRAVLVDDERHDA